MHQEVMLHGCLALGSLAPPQVPRRRPQAAAVRQDPTVWVPGLGARSDTGTAVSTTTLGEVLRECQRRAKISCVYQAQLGLPLQIKRLQ